MTITVEAIYENGTLKLAQPLPLKEQERVQVTVHSEKDWAAWAQRTQGLVPCTDHDLIEWAATDPELDFPPPPEES